MYVTNHCYRVFCSSFCIKALYLCGVISGKLGKAGRFRTLNLKITTKICLQSFLVIMSRMKMVTEKQ